MVGKDARSVKYGGWLPRVRVGQHLSENMPQDQRRLTISRGCCGLCLGMELFAWRIAALPGGNGVLLSVDFIYQVEVGGRHWSSCGA